MSTVPYLKLAQTQLQVALSPADTANPLEAVRQQLNTLLFKFSDKLDGVPLSYGDLKFPAGKESGRFIADQPWVHIDVLSDVLIFRPSVGIRISGKISKVSDNHVGILVFSLFNASISGEDMQKKFKYDASEGVWKSNQSTWREGDDVEFTIASYQHANGVVNIVGKL